MDSRVVRKRYCYELKETRDVAPLWLSKVYFQIWAEILLGHKEGMGLVNPQVYL